VFNRRAVILSLKLAGASRLLGERFKNYFGTYRERYFGTYGRGEIQDLRSRVSGQAGLPTEFFPLPLFRGRSARMLRLQIELAL